MNYNDEVLNNKILRAVNFTGISLLVLAILQMGYFYYSVMIEHAHIILTSSNIIHILGSISAIIIYTIGTGTLILIWVVGVLFILSLIKNWLTSSD